MYNQEQKERFLEYYKEEKKGKQSMQDRAKVVLNRIASFEQSWGIDICYQDDSKEIQKVVDQVSCVKSGTISGQMTVLREYCRWCLKNIPGSSSKLLEIRKPTNDKFKSKTVANPTQLQSLLNNIFNPEYDLDLHNLYRAFLWLAFMGFTESESFEITTDEVDLDRMEIRHGDILAKIYPEAFQSIKNCKELNAFKFSNANYRAGTIDRPRVSGNLLLRRFKSVLNNSMNAEVSRAQTKAVRAGKIETSMRYSTVWESGVFYHAFQQEQTGICPSFRGIAIRQWIHTQRQKANATDFEYDPSNSEKKYRVDVTERNLKRDYKRWKKVHYGI